jgi:membrane-associated phospholipid phosphatase
VSTRTAPEPGAQRSLRARFRAGPVGRRIAVVDLAIYRFVRRELTSPALDRPLRTLTLAGEHAAIWYGIALVAATIDPPRRSRWKRAAAGILATQLLNTALKTVFRRRRPAVEDMPALIAVPTSLSFPSAHAATSFCAARAFAPLLPDGAPLVPLAATIAFSRVYFGVHYPVDVTVGAGLGTLVGGLARR